MTPLPQSPYAWKTELNTTFSKQVLSTYTTGFTTSILNTNHWRTHFLSAPNVTVRCPPILKGSWEKHDSFSRGLYKGQAYQEHHESGVPLPWAVHLVRVTFHLDSDPGWGLRQPVLLRNARAHLGCLSIVAGGGRGHVRLRQVWRSVGTLKQRLVLTDNWERFLDAQRNTSQSTRRTGIFQGVAAFRVVSYWDHSSGSFMASISFKRET